MCSRYSLILSACLLSTCVPEEEKCHQDQHFRHLSRHAGITQLSLLSSDDSGVESSGSAAVYSGSEVLETVNVDGEDSRGPWDMCGAVS